MRHPIALLWTTTLLGCVVERVSTSPGSRFIEPCLRAAYEGTADETEPNDSPDTASDACTIVDWNSDDGEVQSGDIWTGGFIGGDDRQDYYVFRTGNPGPRDVHVYIGWDWEGPLEWFEISLFKITSDDGLESLGGPGGYTLEPDQRYLVGIRVADSANPPVTEYRCPSEDCWI